MNFDGEFSGKKVVITGAAGIYGGFLARSFAAEGAQLCLTDRDAGPLGVLMEECTGHGAGRDSFVQPADLCDDGSLVGLIDAVAQRWGAPDFVINNAGVYPSAFLLDMTPADWDRVFDVNLRAPFVLSTGFARQMIARGVKGAIVNISSGAARKMRRTACAYSTSKTALDRLTKGLAIELAEYGIRANALEPGFAPGSSVSPLSETHVQRVLNAIPLGRPTEQQDIGQAALFLCSQAAAQITGATLSVDGGNSIGSMEVYQDKKSAL